MTDHIGKQECDLKTDHIQQNEIKVFYQPFEPFLYIFLFPPQKTRVLLLFSHYFFSHIYHTIQKYNTGFMHFQYKCKSFNMNYHFSAFYKYSVLYLLFFYTNYREPKMCLAHPRGTFFLYMKVISCKENRQ